MLLSSIHRKALIVHMEQISFFETCSALPAAAQDEVPDWVMLIPAGTSRGVDGRGPYNLTQPEAVVTASRVSGRPLPFDYNHQTVFAAQNGQGSPASGWIDQIEVREGAIWGHVDWTGPGRAAVASREYRYVSPAFLHDKAGNVTKLVSAGLVNSPNLTELPALHAAMRSLYSSPRPIGDTMDEAQLARLRAALGLDANAGADVIVTHAEQRRTAPVTNAPDPSLFVPIAVFTELQATVATLTQTATANRAATLVEDAAKAGKLTPAMREWGLAYASQSPEGFGQWVAAAPVIVAGGADPALAVVDTVAAHASGLTKQELAVCSQFGITPEAYAATKKAA